MPTTKEAEQVEEMNQILEMLKLLCSDVDEIWGIQEYPTKTYVCNPALLPAIDRRQLIRAAFATIEAMVFNLKRMAIMASDNRQSLTDSEKMLCSEITPILEENGSIKDQKARLSLCPNLRFAFQMFAKAWGVQFALNVNCPEWQQLKNSVKVRDRLMHPKKIHDLNITDSEIQDAMRAFGWIHQVSSEVFTQVVKTIQSEAANFRGEL